MAAPETRDKSVAEAVSQALDKAIERNRAGVDPLLDLDLEVGATPKDLVHTNGTLKLYHYQPTCEEIYRVPVIVIPARLLGRKIRKRSTQSLESLGSSVQVLVQMFHGVRTVKALSGFSVTSRFHAQRGRVGFR